jgi:hypothetical protein
MSRARHANKVPVGSRFGRLLVTGREGARLMVLCDCSATDLVEAADLRRGTRTSCGGCAPAPRLGCLPPFPPLGEVGK